MFALGRRAAVGGAAASALVGFRARADGACGLPSIDLNEPNAQQITPAQRHAIELDELESQPPGTFTPQEAEGFKLDWTTDLTLQKKWPVSWETNQAASADESHLPAIAAYHQFDLTHDLLARWASANFFSLEHDRLVLFGVRGASVVEEPNSWTDRLTVTPQCPDHIHNRCLIGVWDRQDRKLVAYTGSTVPNVDCMYWQLHVGHTSQECNMMPTGCYRYKVGPFVGAHSHHVFPSCFLLKEDIFARRTFDDLVYRIGDWEDKVSNPCDDLHPAFFDKDGSPNYFSSAGCQTVCGNWDGVGHRYLRGFAKVRVAAGLPCVVHSGKNGATPSDKHIFKYLLASSGELMLFADGWELHRLRHGSEGPLVADLRKALARKPPGPARPFDGNLTRTLVQWQNRSSHASSGLLAYADAKALAVRLPADTKA